MRKNCPFFAVLALNYFYAYNIFITIQIVTNSSILIIGGAKIACNIIGIARIKEKELDSKLRRGK